MYRLCSQQRSCFLSKVFLLESSLIIAGESLLVCWPASLLGAGLSLTKQCFSILSTPCIAIVVNSDPTPCQQYTAVAKHRHVPCKTSDSELADSAVDLVASPMASATGWD